MSFYMYRFDYYSHIYEQKNASKKLTFQKN